MILNGPRVKKTRCWESFSYLHLYRFAKSCNCHFAEPVFTWEEDYLILQNATMQAVFVL